MLQVGDRMPQFTMRDTKRQEVTQEDFRGAIAIFAFYPMAFTGGCTIEVQTFQSMYEQFRTLGAKVAGVSTDTWAAQGAFQREYGLEFPLLSDWPGKQAAQAFGVLRDGADVATRVTFVFDAAGVLRGVIDDAKNMEAHPQRSLEIAKEIAQTAASR